MAVQKTILLTGGAGYIGSHMNKYLSEKGYKTVVFDNLVKGHKEFVKWGELVEGDLLNGAELNSVFTRFKIDAVIHFAALSYVGESVADPAKYYKNNIAGTQNLLDAMLRNNVKTIIFSSTAATYGTPKKMPIKEDVYTSPINPYGHTKLAIEWMLGDYSKAYDLKFCALRYFNAAGADPKAEIGEWHTPETHLIPLVLDAALGLRENITIFGEDYATRDGTNVRDYIHVNDLASAHLLALEYLNTGGQSDVFNLGTGHGYTNKEVVEEAKKITGVDFKVIIGERRPGDPDELVADSSKAQATLKWKPEHSDLQNIISTAWNWHKKKFSTEYANRR